MVGTKYVLVLAALSGVLAYCLYVPVPPRYSNPWRYRYSMAVIKIAHTVIFTGEYLGLWNHVEALRSLLEKHATKQAPSDDGIKATDAVFDDVKVRIYEPENKQASGPGMVYIHGGGWVYGSVDGSDYMVRYMVKKLQMVTVSVDYRLAPEHPFPVPIEDCEKALKYFLKNAKSFDVDPTRVVMTGDSAGGNLVSALLLKLRDTNFSPKPKLAVIIYPCVQALDFNTPSYQQFGSGSLLTADFMVTLWLQYAQGHTRNFNVAMANGHTSVAAKQTVLPQYINHGDLPKEFFHSGYIPTSPEYGNVTMWAELESVLMNPYYAPLVAKNLKNLQSEILVLTAHYDVLRDEGVLFAKKVKTSGNRVTHIHLSYGYHGIIMIDAHENPIPQSKVDGFNHIFKFIDSKV